VRIGRGMPCPAGVLQRDRRINLVRTSWVRTLVRTQLQLTAVCSVRWRHWHNDSQHCTERNQLVVNTCWWSTVHGVLAGHVLVAF
jgi:hypothetical protein